MGFTTGRITRQHITCATGGAGGKATQPSITEADIESYTHAPFSHCRPFTESEHAGSNAWLAIEAVPEKLNLKTEILGELDAIAPADYIWDPISSHMIWKVLFERRKHTLTTNLALFPAICTVELMSSGETDREIFLYLEDILGKVAHCESAGHVSYIH
ncbi:uncharacterized protein N7484_006875 [Penicillium longicatenatum]|uniref:uncharacterized protein n=1 Tax=Penicillium longicatenatum TaxID=1561947 RepID=UPI002549A3CD|nr:uncharacterized protein N7484_006875 [Penicillium longicatenatum]KAJ5639013.1 hypothetical protein N7484_006875 [Penicillium longicatenatum]